MIERLPQNWCLAPIGACLRRRKETVEPWKSPTEQFGFVGLEDIEDDGRGGVRIAQKPGSEIESLKTVFREGDVLYGKLRPYLNKAAVATQDGICSTDIWAFEATSVILPHFAFHMLSCAPFVERVSMLTRGANLPRIDSGTFDDLLIPLPPLSEQRRVVEILREAEAVSRLRADADRKTAELTTAIFQDMIGDPVANQRGFPIVRLGDVFAELPNYGTMTPATSENTGVVCIRVGNIRNNELEFSDTKFVAPQDIDASRHTLKEGDLLVVRAIGSLDHLGKTAVVTEDYVRQMLAFDSHLMRVRFDTARVSPSFVHAFLTSPGGRRIFLSHTRKSAVQFNINTPEFAAIKMPLPPLAAQHEFLSRSRLAKETKKMGTSGDATCAELLNCLLGRAFTGELTASWRQRHARQLATEARQRDAVLKQSGAATVAAPKPEPEAAPTKTKLPADGRATDLSREQQDLWECLPSTPFTPQSLEAEVRGRLGLDSDAIRRHLEVFVARGLLLAVSRAGEPDSIGQLRFETVFRLPRTTAQPRVLVAISDEKLRSSAAVALRIAGCRVAVADSDATARSHLERDKPAVVVMRRTLAKAAGEWSDEEVALDFAEWARAKTQPPRFVVLRGNSQSEATMGEPWGNAPVVHLSDAAWPEALVEQVRQASASATADEGLDLARLGELERLAQDLRRPAG
jgi:type I restriction enzyme S subunit